MMTRTAVFLAVALALPGVAYAEGAPTDAQCAERVDALFARRAPGWGERIDAMLDEGKPCSASFTRSRRVAYAMFPDWQTHTPTEPECRAVLATMWALGARSHYAALSVLNGPCLEAVNALPDPPRGTTP